MASRTAQLASRSDNHRVGRFLRMRTAQRPSYKNLLQNISFDPRKKSFLSSNLALGDRGEGGRGRHSLLLHSHFSIIFKMKATFSSISFSINKATADKYPWTNHDSHLAKSPRNVSAVEGMSVMFQSNQVRSGSRDVIAVHIRPSVSSISHFVLQSV